VDKIFCLYGRFADKREISYRYWSNQQHSGSVGMFNKHIYNICSSDELLIVNYPKE